MKKEIQIFCFDASNKTYLNIAQNIRTHVFVEEQNVAPDIEIDQYESTAKHFLLRYKNEYIGAARYRKTDNGIKLERFAILKEHRNKNLGKYLLDGVLETLASTNETIYLNSQEQAISFYARNGFEAIGKKFIEANIVHIKMIYKASKA